MTDMTSQPSPFGDNPESDPLLAAACEQGSGRPKRYDTSRLWARVERDTVAAGIVETARAGTKVERRAWLVSGAGLAVAAILLSTGVKYAPDFKVQPSTSHTYTTLRGERANITLSDGTIASLAPETRLTFTSGKSGRTAQLTGQAVFTVSPNTKAPFTVNANHTLTRVLGTVFSIRAYDNDVRVAVKDGKVAVDNEIVSAGYVANVATGKTRIIHNPDAVSRDCSTSTLSFDRTTLAAALPDLERWYDIDINIRDRELLNRTITASFDGTSLPHVVATLSAVLEAEANQTGRTLTFTPR